MGRISVNADAAHAFGANRHGKMIGSIADFTSFSFHAVKNLTTAEGGALTWKSIQGIDDEEIYKKLQLLSLHGQSKDALAKTQLGAWEYDVVGPWYKCNMTDIMAGIGLAQMKRYPGMLERRRKIIGKYDAAFKPLGVETLPHYTDNYLSSGHLYITRVPGITLEQRQEIIVKMAEAGIACNVHYKPLPMMTAYKNLGFDIKDYTLSSTEWAYPRTFEPNVWVDITDTFNQKIEAISCYKSEIRKYPHPRSIQAIENAAGFFGNMCCMEKAEPFILIRKTVRGK